MVSIRFNFWFTTSADLFTPDQFVIKWYTYSSDTCNKLCSSCWNSFWGQALHETFQATIIRILFMTRECTWPWWFTNMLLNWGRSRGLVIDNYRTWLYQCCAGQLGVIRITSNSSAFTFNRIFPITEKGGKAYNSLRYFQLCWNALVDRLCGSAFHDT